MNSKELLKDIAERETLLNKLDKSNPLYPIMEASLLGAKERYDLITQSEERERRKYETRRNS